MKGEIKKITLRKIHKLLSKAGDLAYDDVGDEYSNDNAILQDINNLTNQVRQEMMGTQ